MSFLKMHLPHCNNCTVSSRKLLEVGLQTRQKDIPAHALHQSKSMAPKCRMHPTEYLKRLNKIEKYLMPARALLTYSSQSSFETNKIKIVCISWFSARCCFCLMSMRFSCRKCRRIFNSRSVRLAKVMSSKALLVGELEEISERCSDGFQLYFPNLFDSWILFGQEFLRM